MAVIALSFLNRSVSNGPRGVKKSERSYLLFWHLHIRHLPTWESWKLRQVWRFSYARPTLVRYEEIVECQNEAAILKIRKKNPCKAVRTSNVIGWCYCGCADIQKEAALKGDVEQICRRIQHSFPIPHDLPATRPPRMHSIDPSFILFRN